MHGRQKERATDCLYTPPANILLAPNLIMDSDLATQTNAFPFHANAPSIIYIVIKSETQSSLL
jgi:hypothetical protein